VRVEKSLINIAEAGSFGCRFSMKNSTICIIKKPFGEFCRIVQKYDERMAKHTKGKTKGLSKTLLQD
jgi:hypothetical protein